VNIDTLYVLLIGLCLLNLFVSVFIAKRDDLERFQKIAQIIIVWLIPVIGAIVMWAFNRSNDDDSNGSGPIGGGSHDTGYTPD
jgi:uncharacterized membrane protein YqjE